MVCSVIWCDMVCGVVCCSVYESIALHIDYCLCICCFAIEASVPEVSSVHDGHDQTQLVLGLKSIRQCHDEATVHFGQDPLLNDGPLKYRTDSKSAPTLNRHLWTAPSTATSMLNSRQICVALVIFVVFALCTFDL